MRDLNVKALANAGHWLLEDRGGFIADSGQDTAQIPAVSAQSPGDSRPCPLFPLPMIARIDWESLFNVFHWTPPCS